MAELRDVSQELRLDSVGIEPGSEHGSFGVDESVDRSEPRVERSLDEILTLADEEAEPIAPAAARQLPDELEPLVRRGCDQASSAAFARAAIAEKAAGSWTARSASTLRSSSMFALRQPATNWL